MAEFDKIVLAGAEYRLGTFTVKQVSTLAPLFGLFDGPAGFFQCKTQEMSAARNTIVFQGLKNSGYTGTFGDFENMSGVTHTELGNAAVQVGVAIGVYFPKKPETEPGEVKAGETQPAEHA